MSEPIETASVKKLCGHIPTGTAPTEMRNKSRPPPAYLCIALANNYVGLLETDDQQLAGSWLCSPTLEVMEFNVS